MLSVTTSESRSDSCARHLLHTDLPKRSEYHLNSDIALAAWQYYASTKNETWLAEKGYPLVRNLADMFASFVTYNDTSGMYSTLNETSPDEYRYAVDLSESNKSRV